MNNAIVKFISSLVRCSILPHRTCINQKGYLIPMKEFKEFKNLVVHAASNFSNFMLLIQK